MRFSQIKHKTIITTLELVIIKAGSGRIKLLEQEVTLLKEVQHENIIELFAVYETSGVLFMIMEYCEAELGKNTQLQVRGENDLFRCFYKIERRRNIESKRKSSFSQTALISN